MPEGADPDPGRAAARRHPGPGAGLRCPHGRNRLRHLRPSRHPQSAPAVSSDEALSVITTLGPSYSPVGALLVVVPVVPDLVVIASVFHLSRVLGRDARGSANAPSIPQGSPRLAQEAGRNEQGAGAQQGRGLRHRLGGRRPWDLRSGLRQPPVDRLVGAFRAGIRSTRPGRATTAPRPRPVLAKRCPLRGRQSPGVRVHEGGAPLSGEMEGVLAARGAGGRDVWLGLGAVRTWSGPEAGASGPAIESSRGPRSGPSGQPISTCPRTVGRSATRRGSLARGRDPRGVPVILSPTTRAARTNVAASATGCLAPGADAR
jgi:hypothetical protein